MPNPHRSEQMQTQTQTKRGPARRRPALRRHRTAGPTPAQLVILRWLAQDGERHVRVTMNGAWGCRLYGPGIHPVQRVRRGTFQTLKDRGWLSAGERRADPATLRFDEQQAHTEEREHWSQDWSITPKGRSAAKRGRP